MAFKIAPQSLLRNESMLKDLSCLVRGRVIRGIDEDIAVGVRVPSLSAVSIAGSATELSLLVDRSEEDTTRLTWDVTENRSTTFRGALPRTPTRDDVLFPRVECTTAFLADESDTGDTTFSHASSVSC